MINQLADYKGKGKKIKIFFGPDHCVTGVIQELSPEYVVLRPDEGNPFVVQTGWIIYFQEV